MEGAKKTSRVVLITVGLISLFFVYQAKNIQFDYDFEAFFPQGDTETNFFNEHRQRFESDNDFIFIAIKNEPTVFNQKFLKSVNNFVDSLRQDSLVRDVMCLTEMDEYVKTPYSPAVFKKPYINLENSSSLKKDSTRIFKHQELIGFFINEKADALLVFVKHNEYLSKKKCDLLKENIDVLLKHFELNNFKYAGRTIGLGYYIHKMQNETVLFIGLSFVLVIFFLLGTYKSFWGIWVPLSIVSLSMLWIVGFMALVNQPINMILTVLPSIIFVVAMSDVIHLVTKYTDEIRYGKSKLDAIKTAYKEVGMATLMTSVTTAIGFISLLTVNMAPVRAFGIYTAIGVMLAFVLAYTFLPAVLVLSKAPKISVQAITDNAWYKTLHRLFLSLIRHRIKVVISSVVLFAISIFGLSLIQTNYFLLEDLKESSSLRKDYEYFDKEFMGLRPFELAIEVKDSSKNILSYDVLKEIEKVDNYLVTEYGLRQCFSIITLLKHANRIEHGGQANFYTLPDSADCNKFIEQIKTFDKTSQLKMYIDSTERYGRLSSTIGDIGFYAIRDKNKKFDTFIASKINTNLVSFRPTGTAHLLDRNMSSLSYKLIIGLLISIGTIGLIMGLLYRSARMVIIALIVNILPLVMVAAVLGFTGVNLKVSTAIIFTISFGIAVDDTLHFMSRFKLELKKGKSANYALKRTFLSTGRAIVLTSLILCSGFLLLMASDFLGTVFVGILISLTLLFALIADLFLLPCLLMLFYKDKKITEK